MSYRSNLTQLSPYHGLGAFWTGVALVLILIVGGVFASRIPWGLSAFLCLYGLLLAFLAIGYVTTEFGKVARKIESRDWGD